MLMALMKPEEMRAFAGALPHADFSHLSRGLPTTMTGEMEELHSPNDFITAWAVPMGGFGTDFVRGIEAFRVIAEQAAHRFETTDQDHAAVMNTLVDDAHSDQNHSVEWRPDQLPQTRPLTGPLTPPSELRNDPPSYPQLIPGYDNGHVPPGIGQGR
jgi:hypothetical protein